MKKKHIWPFVAALLTLVLASCYQHAEVEPEPPIHVDGQYHAVYVDFDDDTTHTDINLDIKQVTDSTLKAKMAFYHFYKDNLLYSEVTDECEPVINNDTVTLDFVMSDEGNTVTTTATKRHLNVALRYVNDTLRLLSSSDGDILPVRVPLLSKALTPEDSAVIRFDARLPRMTMVDGMYFVNGPIKKFCASTANGAMIFEYYFDENGVVTGFKDNYGKTFNYEVGEIDEGVYYSLLKRSGWKTELSYNASKQLVSDNTRLSLTSYYYDSYGRMTDGYFKNSRTFYAFELEHNAHGTLVGIKNKNADRYEMKYNVRNTDNYGNPLEQSLEYSNGRVSAPYHYTYEYYE